jgi:nucleoside-diphosphate-sugar epimerase
MKILLTGASSFTGYWFVKSLAVAGHEVVCTLTRDLEAYAGIRRRRIDNLQPLCRLVPNAPFGSDRFLSLASAEDFDQLCHHGADATNYKSQEFDAPAAVRNNTLNLAAALVALCRRGMKSVVLTGTYFEANEGRGELPLRSFSPYSLSKTLTFDAFLAESRNAGVALGKFVIPNPFGPFEEPRFTAFLMNTWKAGQVAAVKTPDYVRDNIHVDLLALAYADFCQEVATTKAASMNSNPSGYVETQGLFAQRAARETQVRTGWPCELKLAHQSDFGEPLDRTNTEPAANHFPDWDESNAWAAFVDYYAK